ncbi:MAG: LuxR C-terminal-related transcriptional regulator [Dehalococcoidia bacterium]|nr:LuxR C-terminal-related transcriptional regulator [Dehalococcoidia bacterium]
MLGRRARLLILDNCEHLAEATAAFAAALLKASPSTHILTTSRTALGAKGEAEWHVSPLGFAPLSAHLTVEEAFQQPAVRLLVERAQAVEPAFTLNEQNLSAVSRLCQQLDGLPLAIELIAARARVLTPDDIAARLNDHLNVQAHANGGRPDRHHTLRASIDWSYALLSAAEQEVFARLSVFVGGCSLAGASEISGLRDEDQTLEVLTRLVEKSLLIAEQADSQMRYRMLETLRQYGLERLQERDSLDEAHGRLAGLVRNSLRRYELGLRGAEQVRIAREIDREYGNITAVLEWSTEHDPHLSLEIVAAIGRFWLIQSRLTEGRRWADQALGACREPDNLDLQNDVLVLSGVLASYQGNSEAMRLIVRRLRQREIGQKHERELWRIEGSLAAIDGDPDRMIECYQRCLEAAFEHGNRTDLAWANAHMGWARMRQGDFRGAVVQMEPSITALREIGDQYGVAWLAGYLAESRFHLGHTGAALELYEESLALFAQLGVPTPTPSVAGNMALLMYLQRNRTRAIDLFRHALSLALERGPGGLAGMLITIARVDLLNRSVAASLVGTADRVRARHRSYVWPADVPFEAQLRDSLRASLGESGFAAAYARGRALPEECIFDEARAAITRIAETSQESTEALPSGLSKREVEVLQLVADGQTNQEIADTLTLSRKTIERHLERIFAKIDVRSRAAATRFAMERGLI